MGGEPIRPPVMPPVTGIIAASRVWTQKSSSLRHPIFPARSWELKVNHPLADGGRQWTANLAQE